MKRFILFAINFGIAMSTSFNSNNWVVQNKCLEIIRLPMLIYDYNEKFKFKNMKEYQNNTEQNIKLINEMVNYAPNGKVEKFIENKKTDFQAAITVSKNRKRLCVVFRGTDSFKDWMFDLRISKVKLNDGSHVHKGFYKQLKKEIIKLDTCLLDLLKKYPDYEVIITGHSLGAALATLYGYILSDKIKNNIKVISFASPKVGNKKFAKFFSKKSNLEHYRFTNDNDIVPSLPPMFNYYHNGILTKLGNKSRGFPSVKDHSIIYYYNNLRDKIFYNV